MKKVSAEKSKSAKHHRIKSEFDGIAMLLKTA